jgi:hypothetical protein
MQEGNISGTQQHAGNTAAIVDQSRGWCGGDRAYFKSWHITSLQSTITQKSLEKSSSRRSEMASKRETEDPSTWFESSLRRVELV